MLVNISILLKFLSTLLPIFKKFIYCTVKENQQRKESFLKIKGNGLYLCSVPSSLCQGRLRHVVSVVFLLVYVEYFQPRTFLTGSPGLPLIILNAERRATLSVRGSSHCVSTRHLPQTKPAVRPLLTPAPE